MYAHCCIVFYGRGLRIAFVETAGIAVVVVAAAEVAKAAQTYIVKAVAVVVAAAAVAQLSEESFVIPVEQIHVSSVFFYYY